jgi:general stress protein YciG
MKKKMPAAVELGQRGGLARARKASRRKLSEIGRKGAAARWRKVRRNVGHLPKA